MSHDSQLVLQQVLDHARKLCGKLPEAEKAKLDEVLNELSDPQVCWAKFLSEGYTKVDGPIDEDDDADQVDCAELPQTYLASVKEKFNKATGSMLDLLLQVMSGKFLQDCRSLATATTTFAQALAVAADGEGQDNCELVKQFQVVLMQFEGNSKSVVALTGSVPAPSLLSSLNSTEDADEADRARQWKSVQAERKRFVAFSVPAAWTKDAILAAFRGSGKVFSHKGSLNTAHRLISAAADLVKEDTSEPWSTQCAPTKTMWEEISNFCGGVGGSEDFIMIFDGRMREVRRWNDPSLNVTLCVCRSGVGRRIVSG